VPEPALGDVYGGPQVCEVRRVAVPEVVQADSREPSGGGHAAEIAALDVPLMQRLAVRLTEDEASVFVFLPHEVLLVLLFFTVLPQLLNKNRWDGSGVLPMCLGWSPHLPTPEPIKLLADRHSAGDKIIMLDFKAARS